MLLRLHPRAGDTLRTRFEQRVQFVGRDGAPAPAAAGPGSEITVLAHSVVERADAAAAVVVAVTDSVVLRSPGASPAVTEPVRRSMQGRRVRLRVATDGATTVLGGAGKGARAGGADAAPGMRFPAALPDGPVSPGAMWARTMAAPLGAAHASIDVWFRFDSLGKHGTHAYLSMRGTVRGGTADAGSVTGALVVDLARGWVADSRTTFLLDGALTPPGGAPQPVRVIVTQRLRAQ